MVIGYSKEMREPSVEVTSNAIERWVSARLLTQSRSKMSLFKRRTNENASFNNPTYADVLKAGELNYETSASGSKKLSVVWNILGQERYLVECNASKPQDFCCMFIGTGCRMAYHQIGDPRMGGNCERKQFIPTGSRYDKPGSDFLDRIGDYYFNDDISTTV